MKHSLMNKILASDNINLLPNYILRKIYKKNKIYFVPTQLKHLPINSHPILSNIADQENIIQKFNKINGLISFHSCPHLLQILRLIFEEREKFNIKKRKIRKYL